MTQLTALELIADRGTVANTARSRTLDAQEQRVPTNMVSYYEGEVAAYNDAYRVMKAELERLQNKFQNNSLTMDDFRTTPLPMPKEIFEFIGIVQRKLATAKDLTDRHDAVYTAYDRINKDWDGVNFKKLAEGLKQFAPEIAALCTSAKLWSY